MVDAHHTPETKTCTKCGETKPLTAFSFKRKGHPTRHPRCKACVNAHNKAYHAENAATILAHKKATREANLDAFKARERQSAAKHRPGRLAYLKEWLKANPEKERAARLKRYAANPQKNIAANKAWREANPEWVTAHNAAYYAENHAKIRAQAKTHYIETAEQQRAYSKAWRKANPEQFKATSKAYRLANPHKVRVRNNRRKALVRSIFPNDFTAAQWSTMLIICDYRCCYCDRQTHDLTQDHLTPVVDGGPYTLWNILPACLSCNTRKQDGPVLKPVQPFLLL